MQHRAASRQIRQHRRTARSKVFICRVVSLLIRWREMLVYRQGAAELEQRIPVVVVRRTRARSVEDTIAGENIDIVVRVGCGSATGHPDAALTGIWRRIEDAGLG